VGPLLAESAESQMSMPATIPVTISPEARSFVDQLGQGGELETMLDRAKLTVPGLTSIEVVLDDVTAETPPGVVLWVHREDVGAEADRTHQDWIDWIAETFPPNVCQNFTLLSVYSDHGR
jgi:hypothetical protein